MTLQLPYSEFPYIWGKYDFLFYQCGLLSGEKSPAAGNYLSYFYALHARIQNISVKLGPEKVHRGAKISGKQFCLKRLHSFAKPISGTTFSLFVNNLPRVLCLSVCDWVCVSQFVSERSAILLVLVIKLTKQTRGRAWRGRDRDGEICKGTDQRGRVWKDFSLFKPFLRSM